VLGRLDHVEPAGLAALDALAGRTGQLGSEPFAPSIADFYLTNPIARASTVMAELSALKANRTSSRPRQAAE
jgi:NADH-quinone oxidoreductase subunit G